MDHRNYGHYSIFVYVISIIFFVTIAVAAEYPQDLVLQNQNITGGEKQRFIATGTITAGPAVTIENGARVILGAGNRITIMPGFRSVNSDVGLFINKDTDADDLFDWWEIANFNNLDQGADGDYDGDLLSNIQEFEEDFNPGSYDKDNDRDGMPDWWEIQHFGSLAEGADQDYDNDHVPNLLEYIASTNPNNPADVPRNGTHYGYDELGRLCSVFELAGGSIGFRIQYAYDEVGNITRKMVEGNGP